MQMLQEPPGTGDDSRTGEGISSLPEQVQTEVRRRLASHITEGYQSILECPDGVRTGRSEDQVQAALAYVDQALPPNTVRAYKSDWAAWGLWCEHYGCAALPAEPMDVAVFLAEAANARPPLPPEGSETKRWAFATTTLARRLTTITRVHEAHGHASPARHPLVQATIRGIRRDRAQQRERPREVKAARLSVIEAMLAELPEPGWPTGRHRGGVGARRNTVARLRDRLLLLTGYAGGLRRSELAEIRLDDVVVDHDAETGEVMLRVLLGPTKTDQRGEQRAQVALPRGRRAVTCPVCAYAAWIELLEIRERGGLVAMRSHVMSVSDAVQRSRDGTHRCDAISGTVLADGAGRPVFPRIWANGRLGDGP